MSDTGTDGIDVTLVGPGSGVIDLMLEDTADDGLIYGDAGDVSVSGFETVNLNLATKAGEDDYVDISLLLDNYGPLASEQVDGIVKNLIITGGEASDDDTLVLDFDIPASISVIDFSGFAGSFSMDLDEAWSDAAETVSANTDTRFVFSEHNADIDLDAQSGDDFNAIFEFTAAPSTQTSAGTPTANWYIDDLIAAGETGATIDNYGVLDVSGLGITSFAELDMVAGNLYDPDGAGTLAAGQDSTGRTLGTGDTVIVAEGGGSTWEIVLNDTLVTEMSASDNFLFV